MYQEMGNYGEMNLKLILGPIKTSSKIIIIRFVFGLQERLI